MAQRINWYESVRQYTLQLVRIRSVSPGQGEVAVAQEVLRLLSDEDLPEAYSEIGLDPVERDIYGRANAYAFLRGKSSTTLLLLGHIDTVDTKDYGALEPWALEPEELVYRRGTIAGETVDQDWMFGRGVADMKSGVAINIALMRKLAREAQEGQLSISVVMLATPDEENESAGILQGVKLLARLRQKYGLTYIGAINTDYSTELYPGDPHKYIYNGTIGKLLPSFLCLGRAAHVGIPFQGLDANLLMAELIREFSMNSELCDTVPGLVASPPVTLHATDLKTHYDVQLPFAAYFYLNVLTLATNPESWLERLRERSSKVLAKLLQRVDENERQWRRASYGEEEEPFAPRSGRVLTYAELYEETCQLLGEQSVQAELIEEWKRWPDELDRRERSLRLVYHLWKLSGQQGPAVVIYYSPPYYPHVAPGQSVLHEAIASVMSVHPELELKLCGHFPYLSDMSYLHLDSSVELSALKSNMPLWSEGNAVSGAYTLPLRAIEELALPVINWGPHGRGAHQHDEAVSMTYTFGILPQLLYETIERLCLSTHQ